MATFNGYIRLRKGKYRYIITIIMTTTKNDNNSNNIRRRIIKRIIIMIMNIRRITRKNTIMN